MTGVRRITGFLARVVGDASSDWGCTFIRPWIYRRGRGGGKATRNFSWTAKKFLHGSAPDRKIILVFAWGTPGYFSKAYHTQALSPPGTLMAPGNRALNRFHISDNVPFQSSFDGCIEKYLYTNDNITTYGTMPYWYLASGGSDSYGPLSLNARTNYYVLPAPKATITTGPGASAQSDRSR